MSNLDQATKHLNGSLYFLEELVIELEEHPDFNDENSLQAYAIKSSDTIQAVRHFLTRMMVLNTRITQNLRSLREAAHRVINHEPEEVADDMSVFPGRSTPEKDYGPERYRDTSGFYCGLSELENELVTFLRDGILNRDDPEVHAALTECIQKLFSRIYELADRELLDSQDQD